MYDLWLEKMKNFKGYEYFSKAKLIITTEQHRYLRFISATHLHTQDEVAPVFL